jgi:hypothetical protein
MLSKNTYNFEEFKMVLEASCQSSEKVGLIEISNVYNNCLVRDKNLPIQFNERNLCYDNFQIHKSIARDKIVI